MNFNTILYRFGFDPDCFINEEIDPIKTDDGFIYEVRQRTDIRICPKCGSIKAHIHDHDVVEVNCCQTDQIIDTLRIIKTRFKCADCFTTYTPEIKGVAVRSTISRQTIGLITGDFTKMLTFTQIGQRYSISTQRVIQIFDDKIPYIPRKRIPEILCIDEIGFKGEEDQNYRCVLYDHDKREVADIIKNRQLPYLKEYFDSIKEGELANAKYFVSDMYDGYRTVRKLYFPKAVHIADYFHVVRQLTGAVNRIRNGCVRSVEDGDHYITFMKNNWKLFLCRSEDIPDKWYTPKKYGNSIHYTDMVFEGIKRFKNLNEAYNILQDLYHYHRNDTFQESLAFIDYIAERLKGSSSEKLKEVGKTYTKWRIEIANGLARNQTHAHYSNGVAESINNNLKTIIKTAYGYHNFKRFRNRALLICNYKKV